MNSVRSLSRGFKDYKLLIKVQILKISKWLYNLNGQAKLRRSLKDAVDSKIQNGPNASILNFFEYSRSFLKAF